MSMTFASWQSWSTACKSPAGSTKVPYPVDPRTITFRAMPCFSFNFLILRWVRRPAEDRSEEHTSELQSQSNLVCRLLLEKKKNQPISGDRQIVASVGTLQCPDGWSRAGVMNRGARQAPSSNGSVVDSRTHDCVLSRHL